jgi:hypothetical protein
MISISNNRGIACTRGGCGKIGQTKGTHASAINGTVYAYFATGLQGDGLWERPCINDVYAVYRKQTPICIKSIDHQ